MDPLSERIAALSPEQRALLSTRLEGRGWAATASCDIPRREHAGPDRLSFAQERLWFLDELEPGNPAYNAPLALRLTGRLDVRVLEQSVGEIVRRHEVLRTSFSAADDGPVAIISPPMTWGIPILDLGAIPPEGREERARELAIGEARRPFDLGHPPLMRTLLIRLGERDHILVLTLHHIICDGWSLGVLVHEMGTLYDAFSGGRPSPLQELSIQYADFARGIGSAIDQIGHEEGCPAVRDSGDGARGDLGPPSGVQPDPRADVGGGRGAGVPSARSELHGCASGAACVPGSDGGGGRGVARGDA